MSIKKLSFVPVLFAVLLLAFGLAACVDTAANDADTPEAYTYVGTEYDIPALEGTVHIPDGYNAPESVSANEVLITPTEADGPTITIKVNDKIYDDVNLAEAKKGEAELYALNAVLGFGARTMTSLRATACASLPLPQKTARITSSTMRPFSTGTWSISRQTRATSPYPRSSKPTSRTSR